MLVNLRTPQGIVREDPIILLYSIHPSPNLVLRTVRTYNVGTTVKEIQLTAMARQADLRDARTIIRAVLQM